jgi:hypothetical protein
MADRDFQRQEFSFQTPTGGGEGSLRGGRGSALQKNPPALLSKNLLSPGLILVGTVHGDPRGWERAVRLLDWLRPELITVEISRFSLRYRARQGKHWQRLLARGLKELPAGAADHPAIRRVMALVALPFEVRAARDWGRRHGVPWRPLDLGGTARRHLPRYAGELLAPDNLRALLASEADGSLEGFVAREFRRARLAYRRSPRRLPLAAEAEAGRRERFLARRLRRLAGGGGRLVHLGGWQHLAPWQDESGLWQLLADLKPGRLLLDEADAIPRGVESLA